MTGLRDRWLRIATAINTRGGLNPSPPAMCSAAADLLGAGGTGLLVMTDGLPGAAFASNAMASTLEDLELTLGVGPGLDAYHLGVPVSEPDLDGAHAERWTGFHSPALAAGACAVFSFPLCVGAARVGAFTVYETKPGPLSENVYTDALTVASVVTHSLLAAHSGAAPASMADGLNGDGLLDATVHQATGMVSVQLGVHVGEALERMRARAFADGVALKAIASEVVDRRLRFDER